MKKKLIKFGVSLLLCCVLGAGFPLCALAGEIEVGTTGELNDSLTVEAKPSSLEKSEDNQSIVVGIEFSETVVVNAVSAAAVLVPEGWSVVVRGVGYTLESGDTEDHLLTIGYDSGIQMIAGAYSDAESYRHIHGLRMTYSVPAGEAGSFTLGLEDLWLGTISGVMVIDGVDVKTVLKITDPGASETLPGDGNKDGVINERDAILMFRYILNLPTDAEEDALDVNEDGKVDFRDAILLFRIAAGQSTDSVSGEEASVQHTFAGLYDESGRMVGIFELGQPSSGADVESQLRSAEQLRVFYLDASFLPVTDQSEISVEIP